MTLKSISPLALCPNMIALDLAIPHMMTQVKERDARFKSNPQNATASSVVRVGDMTWLDLSR